MPSLEWIGLNQEYGGQGRSHRSASLFPKIEVQESTTLTEQGMQCRIGSRSSLPYPFSLTCQSHRRGQPLRDQDNQQVTQLPPKNFPSNLLVTKDFIHLAPRSVPILDQLTLGTLDATDTVSTPDGNLRWDEYTLPNLQAGEQIHIQLNSTEFDPYLQVVDATTGTVLAANDDSIDHNSRLTFTVRAGVTYGLHITSYSGHATGQYELTTERFLPRSRKNFSFDYGYGLVDTKAAVAEAAGSTLFRNRPTSWSGKIWGWSTLNVEAVWKQGFTGKGVTVAVIDTGVQVSHADLNGNLWHNPQEIPGNGKDDDRNGFVDDTQGWNFADNNADLTDLRDHGTHIAGIVAANKKGEMKGIAYDAKVMPIKVVGESGGSQAQVAQGIRYAVNNGADVVNLSLGADPGSAMDNRLKRAVHFAHHKGVMVVVASGNERQALGSIQPGEPAAYTAEASLGLVVGAVDPTGTVASFSNPTGNQRSPFVVAPGTQIFSLSSQDPSGYKWRQGTSMAAAYVSGVVALMLSANPDLSPSQITKIIAKTASRNGVKGH